MPDDHSFLDVRDLKIHFPTDDGLVRSVDGLSFSLHRGRTLGIVGESGSGKSVTSLGILGLHNKRNARVSGEIWLDGTELVDAPSEAVRKMRGRRMAMIFQDPLSAMHPYYTVGRQIIEAYRVHNDVSKAVARKHAIDMLGRVGIPQPSRRVDDYPHQFSGGMRQRAMIAMAIACEPDLVIADEPTTALDVMIQAQIIALLARLREEKGITLLAITHDLSVLAQLVDRVAVMYAGRIVEGAASGPLLAAPKHPYSQALVGAFPIVGDPRSRGVPMGLPGDPPDPAHRPPGCAFHPRCPKRFEPCDVDDPRLLPAEHEWTAACHAVHLGSVP